MLGQGKSKETTVSLDGILGQRCRGQGCKAEVSPDGMGGLTYRGRQKRTESLDTGMKIRRTPWGGRRAERKRQPETVRQPARAREENKQYPIRGKVNREAGAERGRARYKAVREETGQDRTERGWTEQQQYPQVDWKYREAGEGNQRPGSPQQERERETGKPAHKNSQGASTPKPPSG